MFCLFVLKQVEEIISISLILVFKMMRNSYRIISSNFWLLALDRGRVQNYLQLGWNHIFLVTRSYFQSVQDISSYFNAVSIGVIVLTVRSSHHSVVVNITKIDNTFADWNNSFPLQIRITKVATPEFGYVQEIRHRSLNFYIPIKSKRWYRIRLGKIGISTWDILIHSWVTSLSP